MLKGIDVTLYERKQVGFNECLEPIYEETPITVSDALIGEPTTDEANAELQLSGRHLAYTLALPKGDAHEWEECRVDFFGESFKVFGSVTQGIESMIPLRWNRKVKVERYE